MKVKWKINPGIGFMKLMLNKLQNSCIGYLKPSRVPQQKIPVKIKMVKTKMVLCPQGSTTECYRLKHWWGSCFWLAPCKNKQKKPAEQRDWKCSTVLLLHPSSLSHRCKHATWMILCALHFGVMVLESLLEKYQVM